MTQSTRKPAATIKARLKLRTTKNDQLIRLLGYKAGADIKTLSDKLGWQPHTTRAAISRLRKAGDVVDRRATSRGSVYRIVPVKAAS